MAESAHYQQLGKSGSMSQALANWLIEFISVHTDKDYAVEILPAETEYPRLVESADAILSPFIDPLR